MNGITNPQTHSPCGYSGILGCDGYSNTSNIICLVANGDNNFLNEGIVKGTILFIDRNNHFQEGLLNVFCFKEQCEPNYKLSRSKVAKATYIGKVIMAINQYS